MNETVEKIYSIIKDYRYDDGIFITTDDIRSWAEQFGPDADFILEEFAHILPKVYCSRQNAVEIVREFINGQYKDYGFGSVEEYLQKTCFLCMQPDGKSQHVLLSILDEIVFNKVGRHLTDYDHFDKTLYVYLDDVLATGGTIRKDIVSWLKTDDHAELLKQKKIYLEIALICVHTWGLHFMDYGVKKDFGNVNIRKRYAYVISNHLKLYNQKLNIAIPVKDQPKEVHEYLASLDATKYEDYAYRDANKPEREVFFTNSDNRVRYENLLLEKGLYIIRQIKDIKANVRPLGMINPNYKTFGLGTHFFTWRNVPNNCPLVFWWNVEGHNWKPLFPPRRGGAI